MKEEKVIMPKELTAENGAKGLLIGEFFEEVKVRNPDWCVDDCELGGGCDKCKVMEDEKRSSEYLTQKVPVSWTTIKEIYKMAVNGLSQPIEGKQ